VLESKMDCEAEKQLVAIETCRAIYDSSVKEHSNREITDRL
jgi:hypothetical protein